MPRIHKQRTQRPSQKVYQKSSCTYYYGGDQTVCRDCKNSFADMVKRRRARADAGKPPRKDRVDAIERFNLCKEAGMNEILVGLGRESRNITESKAHPASESTPPSCYVCTNLTLKGLSRPRGAFKLGTAATGSAPSTTSLAPAPAPAPAPQTAQVSETASDMSTSSTPAGPGGNVQVQTMPQNSVLPSTAVTMAAASVLFTSWLETHEPTPSIGACSPVPDDLELELDLELARLFAADEQEASVSSASGEPFVPLCAVEFEELSACCTNPGCPMMNIDPSIFDTYFARSF